MTDSDMPNINSLYSIVQREIENDTVQELEPDFYTNISDYIGKLKRSEYDNIEAKIKEALIKMTSELIEILLRNRLQKSIGPELVNHTNLLDEEKFILDCEEEKRERAEMILSSTLNGKSKFLESISQKHKTKTTVVRFLKETDQIVGVDLEKYGPFKSEDIATIPYDNAQALISKNVVTKVRWED